MTYASKTREQQKNFRTLLNGMVEMYGDRNFNRHFKMGTYQGKKGLGQVFRRHFTEHDCDTAACLLGHGPIFGIGNDDVGRVMSWHDYMQEFFGVGDGYNWDFLFSRAWSDDIQEAIARLRMYINGFDPSAETWRYSDRYAP